MRFFRGALVAVPMALVLGLFSTTPAFASDAIDVMDTGQLLANGAAITTQLTVSCSPQFPGDTVSVTLTVTQAVKKGQMTSAEPDQPIFGVPCDDQPHTLTFTLVPSPFAFQKGSAFAQATAGGMVPRFSTSEVIELVK
jgi:hypothetical protein